MSEKEQNCVSANPIVRVIDKLTDLADSAAAVAMLMAGLFTGYEVIVRHFFKSPTVWTYDVSIMIMLWFSFLVAAQALRHDHHIKVDILINLMKENIRAPLDVLSSFVVTIYAAVLMFFMTQTCWHSYVTGEQTITLLQTPVWIIQLGMVLGSVLLVLQSIVLLGRNIKKLKEIGLKIEKGIWGNPVIVTLIFLVVLGIGIYLLNVSKGAALIVTIFALMLMGVPIFASLGMVGTIALFTLLGVDSGIAQIPIIAESSVESYTLMAIPLFIFAGNILVQGDIGKELYDVCVKWIGHIPGGVAVATIGACSIFAAISGSSVATAAIIGLVALPEFMKYEYDPKMAYGLLAAGGTLGILIPPSSSMIVFSSITEESTGSLFMGGIIPGIMMALIFAAFAVWRCVKTGKYKKMPKASYKERFATMKGSFWGLMTPVIILASIYTGICTPTEAASVAVVYALVVSLLRRKISFKQLVPVLKSGTGSSGMILMIVVGAMILGTVTTIMQVPQQVINFVGGLNVPPGVVILFLCGVYVILGMFLEVISIMYITVPIVYPLVISLGYNGVWFGVFITLLMETALITPPVGLNVFVIQGIAKAPMVDVIKGVWPYMALLALGLILLYVFPDLCTWLPSTMGYGGLK